MKLFIRKLMIFIMLLFCFILIPTIFRAKQIRHQSWEVPQDVHVLFLGASQIERGINDSLLKTGLNWAKASERYMFTYIKLLHLLAVNSQIDTVFLQFAPTDLWEDADGKYHSKNEQSFYLKYYWPLFSRENWNIYLSEPIQVFDVIFSSIFDFEDLSKSTLWDQMGGYHPLYEVMSSASLYPSRVESEGYGNDVNYYFLRKIIDTLAKHNIKLYFVYCPMKCPDYYYDQEYFYFQYRKLFSEIEFLDYSSWPINDSLRYDPHHLNNVGAYFFTNELKTRFGIQ